MASLTEFTNEQSDLVGKLLVATLQVRGSLFAKSVIYIVAHDKNGAVGLILNHEIRNVNRKEVFSELDISATSMLSDLKIHFGGPLATHRGFILHSTEYEHDYTMPCDEHVSLTSTTDILQDIAHGCGPEDYIFTLGHASWEPGQLEQEIQENYWMVVPATRQLIFDLEDSEHKWLMAGQLAGIDMYRLMSEVGNA